jgi:hypothetical protein
MASQAHAWVPSSRPAAPSPTQPMTVDFVDPGIYTRDRFFLDFRSPANNVGWKLHVIKPRGLGRGLDTPHLPENYQKLLRYLRVKQIPHKIVANLDGLARMERNSAQVGKFITIYPNDEEQLKRVADIIEALIPDNVNIAANPLAPEDQPVGARGLIGARWGGLTSEFTVDQAGNIITDDRMAGPRPAWVKNPFNPRSTGQEGWVRFDEDQQRDVQIIRRNRRRGGQ